MDWTFCNDPHTDAVLEGSLFKARSRKLNRYKSRARRSSSFYSDSYFKFGCVWYQQSILDFPKIEYGELSNLSLLPSWVPFGVQVPVARVTWTETVRGALKSWGGGVDAAQSTSQSDQEKDVLVQSLPALHQASSLSLSNRFLF